MNYFSDVGKRVLVVEMKVYGFCIFLQPKCQNTKTWKITLSSYVKEIRYVTRDQSKVLYLLYLSERYVATHLCSFSFERSVGHLSELRRFYANALI